MRQPALLIGHGSPMNTLEVNGYTQEWAAMARPRTIHALYGFRQEPFDAEYSAAGDPELAGIAAEEGSQVETLPEGHALGSISMTSYGIGAHVELAKDPTCAAKLPEGVPPDQSNI